MSTNQVTPQPSPSAPPQTQALIPTSAPAIQQVAVPSAVPPSNAPVLPRRRNSPWSSFLALGVIAALAYVFLSRSSFSSGENQTESVRLAARSVLEKAFAYVGFHDWRRGELDRITEAQIDQHRFVKRVQAARERVDRLFAERTRWEQIKASASGAFVAVENCPELFREGDSIRRGVMTETEALSLDDARFTLRTILAPVESAVRDKGDYVPGENIQSRLTEIESSLQRAIEDYQSHRVQLKAFIARARSGGACEAVR